MNTPDQTVPEEAMLSLLKGRLNESRRCYPELEVSPARHPVMAIWHDRS